MIDNLRRLFGLAVDPPTRMTRDEAIAAARDAARAAGIDQPLEMTSVRREGGRTLWFVGTATIGGGHTVVIDDATGAPGPVERWGVR